VLVIRSDLWGTSTGDQVYVLDPGRVGRGLVTSTGVFNLTLELGGRRIAIDPMQYGSVGQGDSAIDYIGVPATRSLVED